MEKWQFVCSDGEVIDADETSSITSDWSIVSANDCDSSEQTTILASSSSSLENLDNLSSTVTHNARSHSNTLRSGSHRKTANRLSHPDPTVEIRRNVLVKTSKSQPHHDVAAAALIRSLAGLPENARAKNSRQTRGGIAVPIFTRVFPTSACLTDRQHSKCLFGGQLRSNAYQRRQIFQLSGDQGSGTTTQKIRT